jgi:hypothetical protein
MKPERRFLGAASEPRMNARFLRVVLFREKELQVLNRTLCAVQVGQAFSRVKLLTWATRYAICTSLFSLRVTVNDSTSSGQTVTQIPHPMQLLLRLFSSSCFNANCITSIPTWQFRLHSPHAMHLSLEAIAKRLTPQRVYHALRICMNFASGHQ